MGGTHDLANLQTLCRECNSQKRTTHANFRKHSNPDRLEPHKNFPSLSVKDKDLDSVGDPEFWSKTLRRAVNLFYEASAVGEVKIGKKGTSFYDWSIDLLGENDARWLEPHLPQILRQVRDARTRGGKDGPDGIRVEGGGFKAAYFVNQDEGGGSPHFKLIPSGTRCRLSVDGITHEGTIQRGVLKIGHRTPYASFSAAFEDLIGRPGKALKAWELCPPGKSEWLPAHVFIERTRPENGD
jgi:HNH endonuclease